jgi:hypothetical protein
MAWVAAHLKRRQRGHEMVFRNAIKAAESAWLYGLKTEGFGGEVKSIPRKNSFV